MSDLIERLRKARQVMLLGEENVTLELPLGEAADELERLTLRAERAEAERDALRADAERWRWISSRPIGETTFAICEWVPHHTWFRTGRLMPSEVGAAIDAAMRGKEQSND